MVASSSTYLPKDDDKYNKFICEFKLHVVALTSRMKHLSVKHIISPIYTHEVKQVEQVKQV